MNLDELENLNEDDILSALDMEIEDGSVDMTSSDSIDEIQDVSPLATTKQSASNKLTLDSANCDEVIGLLKELLTNKKIEITINIQ